MTTRSNVGGWLQGKVVRKGGIASTNAHARSTTPQVQSTSSTVFGGGVKDTSGRTSEYFVSPAQFILYTALNKRTVNGRPMSSMQKRPLLESEIASVSQRMLPQNVCTPCRIVYCTS